MTYKKVITYVSICVHRYHMLPYIDQDPTYKLTPPVCTFLASVMRLLKCPTIVRIKSRTGCEEIGSLSTYPSNGSMV